MNLKFAIIGYEIRLFGSDVPGRDFPGIERVRVAHFLNFRVSSGHGYF